jgi:hypothetical protein
MIKMPPVQHDYVVLQGGMDQITPPSALKPGVCVDALNMECIEGGGYGRIGGYERYSGQPAPSSAAYGFVCILNYLAPIAIGQTITNATATATGKVIAIDLCNVVFTKSTGVFVVGDTIKIGAISVGITSAQETAISAQDNARYASLAANEYRADIVAAAGSGPVRGGFIYKDLAYIVKDNASGTAANLWFESSAGWQQVVFFNQVSFTTGAGGVSPPDGSVVTQGAVTAILKRAVASTGAWTGTAAGILVIANPVGGNFVAGAATISGGTTITLSGAQTAISLLPGGKGESDIANFGGQLGSQRVYYADGVNKMWEFDGAVLVPISTGSASDNPRHVRAFKKHLFFSVQSSAFNSAIGNPYSYEAIKGAAEQPCSDVITGFELQPGSQTSGTMVIFCRNSSHVLYGTSSLDWNLVSMHSPIGAREYSIQSMADIYAFGDMGVYALSASQHYGNFEHSSLTHNIRKFISDRLTQVSCSTLDRLKSQYRIFFKDGSGLYITIINGSVIGSLPTLFPTAANIAFEHTLNDGKLVKFFGGMDGQLYKMDSGTSFDGGKINAYGVLNWNAKHGREVIKRFRLASMEVSGGGFMSYSFGYALGYQTQNKIQPTPEIYDVNFKPSYWDSFTWDNFFWDGVLLYPSRLEIQGSAENIQFTFASNSAEYESYVFSQIAVHYTIRRGSR